MELRDELQQYSTSRKPHLPNEKQLSDSYTPSTTYTTSATRTNSTNSTNSTTALITELARHSHNKEPHCSLPNVVQPTTSTNHTEPRGSKTATSFRDSNIQPRRRRSMNMDELYTQIFSRLAIDNMPEYMSFCELFIKLRQKRAVLEPKILHLRKQTRLDKVEGYILSLTPKAPPESSKSSERLSELAKLEMEDNHLVYQFLKSANTVLTRNIHALTVRSHELDQREKEYSTKTDQAQQIQAEIDQATNTLTNILEQHDTHRDRQDIHSSHTSTPGRLNILLSSAERIIRELEDKVQQLQRLSSDDHSSQEKNITASSMTHRSMSQNNSQLGYEELQDRAERREVQQYQRETFNLRIKLEEKEKTLAELQAQLENRPVKVESTLPADAQRTVEKQSTVPPANDQLALEKQRLEADLVAQTTLNNRLAQELKEARLLYNDSTTVPLSTNDLRLQFRQVLRNKEKLFEQNVKALEDKVEQLTLEIRQKDALEALYLEREPQ